MKLTPRQKEVVEKLQNGWSLWESFLLGSYCTLQKGLPQHGGKTIRVNFNTLRSLRAKGLIESKSLGSSGHVYTLKKEYENLK